MESPYPLAPSSIMLVPHVSINRKNYKKVKIVHMPFTHIYLTNIQTDAQIYNQA